MINLCPLDVVSPRSVDPGSPYPILTDPNIRRQAADAFGSRFHLHQAHVHHRSVKCIVRG